MTWKTIMLRRSPFRVITWKLLSALFTCLVVLGLQHGSTAAEIRSVSAEDLPKLVEAYKGTPLLLVYWASWCAPCQNFKEKLVEIQGLYPESTLRILGVSVDTDQKAFQHYMDRNPPPFPTVIVSDEHYKTLVGLPIPTTVFYDRDGNNVRTLTGNVSSQRLQHYVKKIIVRLWEG